MKSFKFEAPFCPVALLALVLPVLLLSAPLASAAVAQTAPAQRQQVAQAPQAAQQQAAQQQAAKPQAQAQPQNGQQKVPVNGITQAALKAGVKKCAGRMNQFTNFVIQGASNSGAILFVSPEAADAHLVSSSIELGSPNIPAAYATASFSPSEKGCDGMYETVIYWPASCQEVAAKNFQGMNQVGTLSKNIPILGSKGNARVFLLTAGQGCVSIKKEVIW